MNSFEHQAMATQFLIRIENEEDDYAENAAIQCFQRLDELEAKLSRFVADSDISRINKMATEEQLPLDSETWQVIKQAIQAQQWTAGTFDIGVAEHMDIFRATKQGILNEFEMNKALEKAQQAKLGSSIYLSPDSPMIYCIKEGMRFDLGGIGKGYALDQLALLLDDLGVTTYSISAGDSTVMVRNDTAVRPCWEYTISAATEQKKLKLSNIIVSASGTFHQGNHIFDPRTGQNTGISEFDRIWVASENGAYSDAFSTGLFLLSVEEIEKLVDAVSEITWVAYSKAGKLHFLSRNPLNFVA
ncbi:MAG: hypothetical protein HEP71_01260 [Roseivirga sp.]|nr:hypothetical protein [Roseivirga sp.]